MESEAIFTVEWAVFVWRLLLNMAFVLIISRIFYFSGGRGRKEYLFTYLGTSAVLFVVCFLISRVELDLGFAIGLFAVFSLIRYRSFSASPRELAYLFICLGLSLSVALLPAEVPFIRTLANFLIILLILALCEFLIFRSRERLVLKEINYDRLELLGAEREKELLEDLENRFGLREISKVQEGNIDTLKSRVKLRIQLRDPGKRHFQE